MPHLLMHGVLLMGLGAALYLAGVSLALLRAPVALALGWPPHAGWAYAVDEAIVWYSGLPIALGLSFAFVDLLRRRRARQSAVRRDPVAGSRLAVALTAYDDEESIGPAVRDFLAHPLVDRVIVVSNNSRDATLARAREAGAEAVDEPRQGYGRCVHRCFLELLFRTDHELLVLCEGDRTFRAADLDKLLAYAPHADIVNGTRIAERLRARGTQLSTFMYYGNLFVAKLLEAKHLGRTTLTDVGATYKLCRRTALAPLLPLLDPAVNLEFNAHFLDVALAHGCDVVECPITFHARVGRSKGGNADNLRALLVGGRMLLGLVCGWRRVRG